MNLGGHRSGFGLRAIWGAKPRIGLGFSGFKSLVLLPTGVLFAGTYQYH